MASADGKSAAALQVLNDELDVLYEALEVLDLGHPESQNPARVTRSELAQQIAETEARIKALQTGSAAKAAEDRERRINAKCLGDYKRLSEALMNERGVLAKRAKEAENALAKYESARAIGGAVADSGYAAYAPLVREAWHAYDNLYKQRRLLWDKRHDAYLQLRAGGMKVDALPLFGLNEEAERNTHAVLERCVLRQLYIRV